MAYLPIKPQWAPGADVELEKILDPAFESERPCYKLVILEWGNGCSTPWVAQRCHTLFAVDDDPNWSRRAEKLCGLMGVGNVDFSIYPGNDAKYFETIWWFSEMRPIDLAIVDGVHRMCCFDWAVRFVRPGGYILLDDSQRDEYKTAFRPDWWSHKIERVWTIGAPGAQQTTLFRKAT